MQSVFTEHFSVRSPLRYPGGKSRASFSIFNMLPSEIDTLCSPFLGGGSVELMCASRGIKVYGYDYFEPLVNFWKVLLLDSSLLAERVRGYYPLSKERFKDIQSGYWDVLDTVEQAAVFYVINRSSFSGCTFSGGMSLGHKRFTEDGIRYLSDFNVKGLSVDCLDFRDSIGKHNDDFLYLDPPYLLNSRLYGVRGDMQDDFDHEGLRIVLGQRGSWLLSYNDCPAIRDLYAGYRVVPLQWSYGMGDDKHSSEILIFSK